MRILIFCCLFISLISCEQWQHLATEQPSSCFPTVVVDAVEDTVEIGETFKAKVYLSDSTSFYFISGPTGEKVPINPIFKVNGEIIESTSGNYLMYEEVVSKKPISSSHPEFREISFGIVIPHPEPANGDVEFSFRYTYVASQNRQSNAW